VLSLKTAYSAGLGGLAPNILNLDPGHIYFPIEILLSVPVVRLENSFRRFIPALSAVHSKLPAVGLSITMFQEPVVMRPGV